jgi:hypothetical protein
MNRKIIVALAMAACISTAYGLSDSSIPTKIPTPWATSAPGGNKTCPIPIPSQILITPGRASWTDGFPPLTFQPSGSGGIPPSGADFNGVLCQVSQWIQWYNAGGPITYDSTFQTAIAGYPKGALVQSATIPGSYWLSTTDSNTSNPDTGGANWRRPNIAPPVLAVTDLKGVSAGAIQSASWTAAQLTAGTALGGAPYFGSSLTLAFNGATTGAGGMDTGSMPSNADLSIYAIYNPTTDTWSTLGVLGSTSSGPIYAGANMPSGYTASALIWAGVTTGTNLQKFVQQDHRIWINVSLIANGIAATSFTAQSLTAYIPAAAKTWFPTATGPPSGASTLQVAAAASGPGNVSFSGNTTFSGPEVPIAGGSPQTTFYVVSTSTTGWALYTQGYTF